MENRCFLKQNNPSVLENFLFKTKQKNLSGWENRCFFKQKNPSDWENRCFLKQNKNQSDWENPFLKKKSIDWENIL